MWRSCAIFALAIALASAVLAQAPAAPPAAFGSLEGRVQNVVTGDNINNARVSIQGTNLVQFTDDAGFYRFARVAPGRVVLHVSFTGLDAKDIPVTISPGQTAEQDVKLTSVSRYGATAETVKLDTFVVQSTKETNAAAIAVNEQRYSARQENVVSADQFGVIPDSNPGELVKWLPGVSVEYFANTIIGVSVRGLDSANTEINFDGMPVASTTSSSSNNGRGFEMRSASASDIARVEVRLLPLPEDSANTLGGSLNFVRRSAFEYNKRKIEYRALFTSDAQHLTLSKRDGPKDRKLQWWRPNFQLRWTEPVSRDLGFAVTLGHDDKVTDVHWSFPTWNFGNTTQAAQAEADMAAGRKLTTPSVYNPVKTTDGLHQNPAWIYRDYVTVRGDWRPVRTLRFSYSVNANMFRAQTADDVRFTMNTGAFGSSAYGSPTGSNSAATNYATQPTLGQPGTNDQYNIYGPTGTGSILFDTREGWRTEYNPTITQDVESEWHDDLWTVSAKGSYSFTKHTLKDIDDGFFNNMTGTGIAQTGIGTGTANPRKITVNLLNETKYIAQTVEARDATTGQLIDWQNPANMYIGGATSRQGEAKETVAAAKLFVKRNFNLSINPVSIQLGLDLSDQYRNHGKYKNDLWNFVGADGIKGTADDSADQIAAVNITPARDFIYNAPAVPRLSMSRLYKLYQDHPSWFQYNDAESYRGYVTNSYQFDEKTTGIYLQAIGTLFSNRLQYAGGIRYERTTAWGIGFLDRGTRFIPTGVSATSLAGYQARYIREGARGDGENHNYYPRANVSYNLTPDLILRVGYAKTQAKNRFDRSVIPNTTVSDSAVTSGTFAGIAGGTINLRNPDLLPWVAYNYETHLEYYVPSGGVISAGLFRKSIHNWQTTTSELLLTQADVDRWNIDPAYLSGVGGKPYQTSFTFNDGNARLDGADFAITGVPLASLVPEQFKRWVRAFSFTGSFNYNDLRKRPGDNISTDFSTLYSTQTKAVVNYSHGRIFANVALANYGKVYRQTDSAAGHFGSRYYPPFNQIDFNFEYRITKAVQLFVSGLNVTGARKLRERVVEGAPAWSRMQIENNLGKTYTVGIKGEF
jgi:iron complex outermembrane recepter protein